MTRLKGTIILIIGGFILATTEFVLGYDYGRSTMLAQVVQRIVYLPVPEVRYEFVVREVQLPPKIITQEVPVILTKEVKLPWDGRPFKSRQELEGYLSSADNYTIQQWGVANLPFDCEDYTMSLAYKMIQDGYLVGMDLDEARNHYWISVPIPSENRYYFVEPKPIKILDNLHGKIWRLD